VLHIRRRKFSTEKLSINTTSLVHVPKNLWTKGQSFKNFVWKVRHSFSSAQCDGHHVILRD